MAIAHFPTATTQLIRVGMVRERGGYFSQMFFFQCDEVRSCEVSLSQNINYNTYTFIPNTVQETRKIEY